MSLGCDATLLGKWFPTFWRNVLHSTFTCWRWTWTLDDSDTLHWNVGNHLPI